jgi:hypothetical protein
MPVESGTQRLIHGKEAQTFQVERIYFGNAHLHLPDRAAGVHWMLVECLANGARPRGNMYMPSTFATSCYARIMSVDNGNTSN